MALSEFALIRQYFAQATAARDDVVLGIGDDCALLTVPPDRQLAVSIDTLVEGRHFAPGADPRSLGHKALAVNLSDLAAMGAEPAWATLALTLPQADPPWLEAFVAGFAALAGRFGVQLVGGDTTRGPLSITIQVHGFVEPGAALRRDGACPGDWLFVSGTVGDAGLALQRQTAGHPVENVLLERLDRPMPRVALGRLLSGRASAAIDVSDGLASDLAHLCGDSGVAARIELSRIPLSVPVAAACAAGDWQPVLAGGDDYELLFSVPEGRVEAVRAACDEAGEPITMIGRVGAGSGIVFVYPDGRESNRAPRGFDHFADSDGGPDSAA